MAEGLEQVARLPDRVGERSALKEQPSGIKVGRMRVPLGVIGIVYESRPNVTADAAALCLKAGNACILRGGSEAVRSNLAIAACVHEGLGAAGLPEDAVQVIETADRTAVGVLLSMNEYFDIIAPPCGKDLIQRLMRASRIPLIEHLTKYGAQHADAIGTEDEAHAKRFLREVDSSSVLVNASTRFADGFEYGLGAEIGISTDKLHARGPVGLEGLTSQKYVVFGSGQIRA